MYAKLALLLAVAALRAGLQLINTTAMKNAVATAYGTTAAWVALYSTVPGGSAGTELTGGSPAYARKATSWGAPSAGVITSGPHVFDVASGSTVAGGGFHSAVTAGTYYDGFSLPSQAFASQGTYSLTVTYTQT